MNRTERNQEQEDYDAKMRVAKKVAADAARECARAMIEIAETLEDDDNQIEDVRNSGVIEQGKASHRCWKLAWKWLVAYRDAS